MARPACAVVYEIQRLGYPAPVHVAARLGWEPYGCPVCCGEMEMVQSGPEYTVWQCAEAGSTEHQDRSEVVCLHVHEDGKPVESR